VADVDIMADTLITVDGTRLVHTPQDSPWGRRAVIADPDGHRIELAETINL
jgi:hypothetical protein